MSKSILQPARPSGSSKMLESWMPPTCAISSFSFSRSVSATLCCPAHRSTGLPSRASSCSDACTFGFRVVLHISVPPYVVLTYIHTYVHYKHLPDLVFMLLFPLNSARIDSPRFAPAGPDKHAPADGSAHGQHQSVRFCSPS